MQHKIVHRNRPPWDVVAKYDRPAWAWEYLRRNPSYREFYRCLPVVPVRPLSRQTSMIVIEASSRSHLAAPWGCTFAEDPDRPYPEARVFWDAAADPGILPISLYKAASWPAAALDVIDFAKLPATVTVLRLDTGHEYIRIAQGPYAIQLYVTDGSALDGPVTFTSHISGYSGRLKSLTQQRLRTFCRTKRFQPSLFSNKKDHYRSARWLLGLQALDMIEQDSTEAKIAEVLFGQEEGEGSDWRRSRVSRLLKAARRYVDRGYLDILASGDKSRRR